MRFNPRKIDKTNHKNDNLFDVRFYTWENNVKGNKVILIKKAKMNFIPQPDQNFSFRNLKNDYFKDAKFSGHVYACNLVFPNEESDEMYVDVLLTR